MGIPAYVKMKNKLYKYYLNDPTEQKLYCFKEYRSHLNKIKRHAEKLYYEREF